MDVWEANLHALEARPQHRLLAARLRRQPKLSSSGPASCPKPGVEVHERARLCVLLGFDPRAAACALQRPHLRTLLILEPDLAVLRSALTSVDLRTVFQDPRLDMVIGDHNEALWVQLDHLWRQPRYLFFARSLDILRTRGDPAIERCGQEVLRAVEDGFSTADSDPEDARQGLAGLLANLANIAALPEAGELQGIYRGRPGFVVSSGPSLTHSLPRLAACAVDRHFPVFCPDTSLPLLRRAGLDPHVVASKERVKQAKAHFRAAGDTRAGLVACPVVPSAIIDAHPGPRAFVYRSADFARWLGVEPFEFGGSAGNLAFRLAELAGCDPIILVGQDLCFAENGDTHAPGTALGERQPNHHRLLTIDLPARRGGTVQTTPKWRGFLRQFEMDIARSSARVMNTTYRGVAIQGAEDADLDELLERLDPGEDPRPAMEAALQLRPADEQRRRREVVDARVGATRETVTQLAHRMAAAEERARSKRWGPVQEAQGPPPWLEEALGRLPLLELERSRNEVLGAAPEVFDQILMPVLQSVFLQLEIERFEIERVAGSAAEFEDRMRTTYQRWFETMLHWTQATRALLEATPPLVPRVRAEEETQADQAPKQEPAPPQSSTLTVITGDAHRARSRTLGFPSSKPRVQSSLVESRPRH